MVLVDTSVWILHLRKGSRKLENLLNDGNVACHPFIIGELACGNLTNRKEILSLLNTLPMSPEAEHGEVMQFIENYRLMGKGLGYIDMHLLTSALLNQIRIWTIDGKLKKVSSELGIGFS
jgi:predicted nucleic acid-binding protein